MLKAIAEVYNHEGSARATAQSINMRPGLGGHGPYRFDHDRTDFRFYLNSGVAYYRLVEMAIPQAISQWYLDAGAAPLLAMRSCDGRCSGPRTGKVLAHARG